jgi:hypothetical protein
MPTSEDRVFPESLFSQNLRTPTKTYYFDVREAKNGVKYLTIAESRIQDGQRTRSYFTIFPEQLDEFCKILVAMQAKIKE